MMPPKRGKLDLRSLQYGKIYQQIYDTYGINENVAYDDLKLVLGVELNKPPAWAD